jgi:signal transduction histidine kinase
VGELDATIRDIRKSIFELRAPVDAAVRTRLGQEVAAAADLLGFCPTVRTHGPIDSALPEAVRPDLFAVLREALSNVVRHARASSALVEVTAAKGRLTLSVTDDGVGADPTAANGGLLTMRERAEKLGGDCTVRRAEPAGTVVEWSVPLTD